MGQLVFQATAGGQVALVGPNPSTNFALNVPAVNGNLVTTGDTGTVTNTMLASNVYTAPGTIGSVTPNTGAFTTLSASSTVSGTGFSDYLASPPAIGGTTAAAGSFTNLAYTGTLTGGTGVVNLGSGQFYKNASGYVGIGTTTINSNLSLGAFNTAGTSNSIRLYDDAAAITSTSNNSYGFGFITNGLTYTAGTGGSHQFYTANSERMRIDSSGNVGIGNSSPSTYANGFAPVFVTGSSPNWFIAQGRTDGPSGATNGVRIGGSYLTNPITGSNIFFGAQGGSGQQGIITFNTKLQNDNTTQPAEAMRIDSSGNVLVNRSSQTNAGKLCLAFAGATNQGLAINDSSNQNGAQFAAFYYGTSTFLGSITNVGGTAVAFNTTSDYRLKDNVKPMVGALATVSQLNPVTYEWKVNGSSGQGFIAHELQAVVPECVTGEKDAVDEEGNPKYQGIDTSFLVATLTAAIQELNAKVTALEAQLGAK